MSGLHVECHALSYKQSHAVNSGLKFFTHTKHHTPTVSNFKRSTRNASAKMPVYTALKWNDNIFMTKKQFDVDD